MAKSKNNNKVLGIDFGTSYCTMAAWNDQDAKPVVIRGRSGNEKIPTVVFWSADGNHEVGEGALNRWMDGGTPEEQWELQQRTIRSIKRNFSPQYVIPMPDGSIVRAVDVAAVVLKQLKTEAEEGYFHEPVSAVRITYPATFTRVQQDLLRKAAKTAGFEKIEFLEEPIAAVLGYAAVHNNVGNGILVYDLGGGTLDLAYVRRDSDGSWTIPIPPSGSPDCGGDDFDRMIYDWAQQKFLEPGEHFGQDEYNVNQEILLSCRDLKESLSSHETGMVSVFHDNKRLVLKLPRQEFNRLIEEKITNSIDMVRQLLQDITAAQQTIDAVILIGGSSRIPFIREKLTEVLPIKPLDTMVRDIAVALGAAGNEKLSLTNRNSKTGNSPKAGEQKILTINEIDYTFCWCPPGTFMMGPPKYQHKVTLTRGFWMLETQVTQLMWKSVMGGNPSQFVGDDLPVERVSWNDCQKFINKLNGAFDSSLRFRLPTESEWEYACRAGTTGAYGGTGKLADMGWNWRWSTQEVKTKQANAWGLYDMHGNVWEWCEDLIGTYPIGSVTDPRGSNVGWNRVIRGGSWRDTAGKCQSTSRDWGWCLIPWKDNRGFRLALSSKD